MTPLGQAVHARCKTGECRGTAAAERTTTVAAVVALLALSGSLRLMDRCIPDAMVMRSSIISCAGLQRIRRRGEGKFESF